VQADHSNAREGSGLPDLDEIVDALWGRRPGQQEGGSGDSERNYNRILVIRAALLERRSRSLPRRGMGSGGA